MANKLVFLFAFALCAFLINFEADAQLLIPEGRRLREIVDENYPERKLLIGGTTGSWGLNEFVGELMDREFSYVTPENDFKHSIIRGSGNPNYWDWSRADAWLQHIINNSQVLRIHGPIAPQCSNWAKEDNRTAEELSEELDTFMTALCQRYNGVEGIKYLDVVNEIALEDGSWHGPKIGTDQWENPWLKIGQDNDPNKTPLYVKQAFAIANEHAPDLKQIINNHCHPGTKGMEKVKETVLYLRDRGYRVDGLGWQAHIDVGWATEENLQHLRDVIDWCQERNLEFHITEFDAFIKNPVTQSLEEQAYTYKAIMDVLLEKLDSLTIGWNTWQITDAHGWRTEYIPAVFDDKYKPKPAYYAMQLALETKGDYSIPYNVTFKVKNSETGEFINNYEVLFHDSIKQSSQEGETLFQQITPGRYTLQIKKSFFSTLTKKNLNVYSDTTITLLLNPAIYSTTFHLINQYSGDIISSVSVTADTILEMTGLDGNANFGLRPGTYHVNFDKQGFQNHESDFTIVSDTIITIPLKQKIAYIKFRVKNNEQPINNTQIILDKDTVYTNSLGIATFKSLNVDSSYYFYLAKEKYKSVEGNLVLNADTTVDIQLQKNVANIQFQILPKISNPENGYVVIDNDTVFFNANGISNFYDIPVDIEYQYKIFNNNFSEILDTIYLTNDTTINITMVASSLVQHELPALKIYPNPVGQVLHIESDSYIKKVHIYNILGKKIMEFDVSSNKISKNCSHIAKGVYLLDIHFENGRKRSIRFIKNNP